MSKEHQCVRVYKLSKSYDGNQAVKELSLQMQQNEVFCLLGQNGAGKTTTINVRADGRRQTNRFV